MYINIYVLYTWNWHNIVNQLYFNKAFFKWHDDNYTDVTEAIEIEKG